MSDAGPDSRLHIQLQIEESGAGRPLLLLHGFTGAADTWRPFRDAWPGMRQLAADLPGHGRSLGSPETPVAAGISSTIDALLAAMDDRGIAEFALLGYSMGGRVALRLALRAPERVSALIVVSASPGIDDATARAARLAADRALADRIERDGVPAFVDYWQSLPLWASQRRLPPAARAALRAQRLRNDPAGLAVSLRAAGAGADPPVLDALGGLRCPALLVAGALDPVYCDHAAAMAERLPDGRVAVVPDAGHAVHLDQPGRFGALIAGFLSESA